MEESLKFIDISWLGNQSFCYMWIDPRSPIVVTLGTGYNTFFHSTCTRYEIPNPLLNLTVPGWLMEIANVLFI